MCVSEGSSAQTQAGQFDVSGSGSGGGSIEHIAVMAPRITLNTEIYNSIDWGEVTRHALIGFTVTAPTGPLQGLIGTLGATALAIESQDNVDLEDLFETVYDIPVIPGLPAPLVPLY